MDDNMPCRDLKMKRSSIALIVLAVLPFLLAAASPVRNTAEGLIGRLVNSADIGDSAPNFSLANVIDGNTVILVDCRGKVVLLDFFAILVRTVLPGYR
jgi:hypothetical protein